MTEEITDEMIEQLADDLDEGQEDEQIIKKRRPTYTKEYIERRRVEGKSKENIERLRKMREKKIENAKLKRIQKMKEELIKNGIKVDEPKKEEPIKAVEPPKVEIQSIPPVIAPIIPPAPQPVPVETPKPKKKSKPKPKKKVQYIDDEEAEEEYDEEPQPKRVPIKRPPQELNDDDMMKYMQNRISRMDLNQIKDQLLRRQYDREIQRMREEAMSNMIVGKYY